MSLETLRGLQADAYASLMEEFPRLRVALNGPVPSVEYEAELVPPMDLWTGGLTTLQFGDRNLRWRLSYFDNHSWHLCFKDTWNVSVSLPGQHELEGLDLIKIARPVDEGFVVALEVRSYARLFVSGCWLDLYVVPPSAGGARLILREGNFEVSCVEPSPKAT